MRPASLFLASGLILAIGCGPAPEATTETTVGAVRTLPETTATETVPPFKPPAGLVEAVTISITGDDRDRDDVITVANEDEVGLFTSIASCSLVEGSGWFPLEIVAADRMGSFLRLWSHTYSPEGLGAIEGELIVHHPDQASLAAAVTVFVGVARPQDHSPVQPMTAKRFQANLSVCDPLARARPKTMPTPNSRYVWLTTIVSMSGEFGDSDSARRQLRYARRAVKEPRRDGRPSMPNTLSVASPPLVCSSTRRQTSGQVNFRSLKMSLLWRSWQWLRCRAVSCFRA